MRAPVLAALRAQAPDAWRDHAQSVPEAIEHLARLGFTRTPGAWQHDVHAVAVPMRTQIDGETPVFNCGVLAIRLTPGMLEQRMGPGLMEMVHEVEMLLAGAG